MQAPSVETVLNDRRANVRWRIVAYRTLTRSETLACVRQFLAARRRRKIKPGTEITIMTIIGFDD